MIKMMLCQTRRSLYVPYVLSFKLALSIYQTNMSIAIELHSSFLKKMHKLFIIIKQKNPLTVSSYTLYLHPDNSNGRCSGTILRGNTCVTVLVIGGGDIGYFFT